MALCKGSTGARLHVDVIRVYTRTGKRYGRSTELSCEVGDVLRTPPVSGLDILSQVVEPSS
jgi:hypothetical protein